MLAKETPCLHLEVSDPLEFLGLRLLEAREKVVHRLLPLLQLAVLLVPLGLILLNVLFFQSVYRLLWMKNYIPMKQIDDFCQISDCYAKLKGDLLINWLGNAKIGG